MDRDAHLRREAEVEEMLRAELEAARLEYMQVKERYRKTAELVADIGPFGADGQLAIQMLVRAQGHAVSRYAAALREFDDFVIGGVIPHRFGKIH